MLSWKKILHHIKSIRSAPVSGAFVIAVVIVCVGTWGVAYTHYSPMLSNRNAEIQYLSQQNMDYREKLGRALSTEPQSRRRPKLMLAMTGVDVSLTDPNNTHEHLTGIGINVKLWNTGAPSVATEWLLYIVPEGGAPLLAQSVQVQEPIRADGPIGSYILREPESFEVRTKTSPVQSTPVEGKLFFNVAMKRDLVLAPTTRLDLIVKDVDSKETKATKYMAEWLQH
jgi:hypothetical protein